MLYFLKKAGKITAALAAPSPNPVGLRLLEALPPDPQFVTLTQLTCYFRVLFRFVGIVKITTYYLILERRLEGLLSQACSPWLKPLVTPMFVVLRFLNSLAWASAAEGRGPHPGFSYMVQK